VIKYSGSVHFAYGIHYGIELKEPFGNCDGQWLGIRYFYSSKNCGVFAKEDDIQTKRVSIDVGGRHSSRHRASTICVDNTDAESDDEFHDHEDID